MGTEKTVAPGRSLRELTRMYFDHCGRVEAYFFGERADRPKLGFDAVLRATVRTRAGDLPAYVARMLGAGTYPVAIIYWEPPIRRALSAVHAARALPYRVTMTRGYRFFGATIAEAEALRDELATRLAIRYQDEDFVEEKDAALRQIICPLRPRDRLIEVRFGFDPIPAVRAAAA